MGMWLLVPHSMQRHLWDSTLKDLCLFLDLVLAYSAKISGLIFSMYAFWTSGYVLGAWHEFPRWGSVPWWLISQGPVTIILGLGCMLELSYLGALTSCHLGRLTGNYFLNFHILDVQHKMQIAACSSPWMCLGFWFFFLVTNYIHFVFALLIFIYLFLAQVVSIFLYLFRQPFWPHVSHHE